MKLVVGLGNPGPRYQCTRHNAGFMVAERFAARCGVALAPRRLSPLLRRKVSGRFGRGALRGPGAALDVGVLLPESWMNLSGEAVAWALRRFPVGDPRDDLLLLVDDVDLPFGQLRVRPSGSSAGHRGLSDVAERLGRSDFPRLRFGIGRPPDGIETADHVLRPFSSEEKSRLAGCLERAAEAVEVLLLDGIQVAMNRYNRAPDPSRG